MANQKSVKQKIKSVDSSKYDEEYFVTVLSSVNYKKPVKLSNFKPIHHYIASLVSHDTRAFIVDFGCGNGDLTFLLAMKYKCRVLGVDYSADAIKIANKNKRDLEHTKSLSSGLVKFISAPNDKLPKLKNVTTVIMADVIEHLYPQEVALVLKTFEDWNNKNLQIIIHTDNNNYLRFIRPFFDLFSVLTRRTTLKKISDRNQWEKERHVNLTTPKDLQKTMAYYGYETTSFMYSPITQERIRQQLGTLQSIPFLVLIILKVSEYFSFLLPSFYIAFKKAKN